MIGYLLSRVVQSILILFVLSFVIYGMLNFMPGDPYDAMISSIPNLKPEDIARIKKQKGLDKPFHVRYGIWLYDTVIEGDLGNSQVYLQKTEVILFEKIGNTLKLTLLAFFFSMLIAIPVGIFCAVKQYTALDYVGNFFAFVGISIPTFWFGQMMIYMFAEKLQWLPAGGLQDPNNSDLADKLRHLLMPAIVLGIAQTGAWLRYTRSSMLEVIRADYVRTARAKGLDEETVILRHAFRNALIPIVTVMALNIPFLFSGAVITEKVFSYPGMGSLIFDSVIQKDYYVAMMTLLAIAAITLICNLLADVLYATIDPRIRTG